MQRGRAGRSVGWVGRLSAALGLALGSAAAAPPRAGAADVAVENLRVGFAGASAANQFKIGAWTPVWVQLKGGAERFAGELEVEVPDDDGTPTSFRQPVEVGAGQSARVVAYARPGSRDPNFFLRLVDGRGRRVAQADGSALAQLDPVPPDALMLLTLGKPQGVEQVTGLPGYTADPTAVGRRVAVGRVEGGLPARWYGYDAADGVVVDTNDKDLMNDLGVRGQALVDWVARGGHLVVAVGGNWQSARDSVLGPILPAVPAGQQRVTNLGESLDPFAASNKSITPPGTPPVLVTKLEGAESRGGKVLAASGDLPLVVRGPYGFGRVTLVALDVDARPFADWPDRANFWVKALDLRRQAAGVAGDTVSLGGGGRRLYQSGVSDLATQLRQALEQFPGVKLIPFGWVAFFIFLYILLIGPGDYFFLKKVVKRMELTWVTFPLIVTGVSLLAYFAAYSVKGTALRVNKVDVVDIDQAAGLARGSTFVNLFSPQNRDYGVAVVPLPLEGELPAPPPEGTWAATAAPAGDPPPRPPAGTEVLVSWLGVPEAGFGGMGNSGRVGFTGGGYTSLPPGGSERLAGVRVPIWSTKLLEARWFGPAAPAADSDLLPVGSDRLSGTVTNRLAVPMEDAILAFGKHVYQLGKVAPGAAVRVELAADRQLSGLLKARYSAAVPEAGPDNPEGRIVRPDLLLALMFHDSQGATAADRPLENNPLHGLDLTGQLALDRPMLVAQINRPAARLVLENAPSPPKVEQTTMIRVILPLGKVK